jgi:chromosome segregation ATPase
MTRLTELGEVKILPASFAQERRDAVRDLNDAQRVKAQVTEELRKRALSIGQISIPESLVEQADAATDLFQRYGGHVKAQQDLPGLERDQRRLLSEAQAIQKELRPGLAFEHVESMRMTSQKIARIQDLILRHQSLRGQIPKARKVLEDLKGELEAAQQELSETPALRDPNELRSAVDIAIEEGNLEKQTKSLAEKLRLEQEQAGIGLKSLRLWSGSLEQLESLAVPAAETIQRFERQFEDGDRDLRQLTDQIAAARKEVDALNRQIEALRSAGEIPTEGDLTLVRQHREKGWQLVRKAWIDRKEDPQEVTAYSGEVPLPEAYETSVQKADHVSDRLRHDAQLVAKHATLLTDRDRFAGHTQELDDQHSKRQKAVCALQEEWSSLWQSLGISSLPPKEMRAWLQQRNGLLTQASRIRETRGQLDGFRKQIDDLANLLGQCLEKSGSQNRGTGESLQALLARARRVVGQFDETAARRKDLGREIKKLEGKLDREQRDFDQAQEDLRQWQDQWKTAVVEIGLTEKSLPAEANAVLSRIQDLFQKVDNAAGFQARIGAIQQDSRLFSDDRKRFFRAVAPDLLELPENQAMMELRRRQAKAGQDAATLAQLREQQQDLNMTQDKADATIAQKETFLSQLCRQAGCARVEDLEALEQRSDEASGLRAELTRVDESLADYTAGGTIEGLIRQAQEVSPDSLPAQIVRISEEITDLEEKRSHFDQTIGAERSELQKMDGSAKALDAAEQAQSLLAQIHESTERYVRLHLASVILRKEITRYQDANQGPVLVLASRLFAMLTNEAFSTVTASFDQADKPVLLGVRSSGERVTVDGMSDGTRDQLYLALRLAGLQRYLESTEPMPFIIDDILVNFDDHRAAATLKVLADLSMKTQVVFFTHHSHVVELANKVVPDDVLRLHSLGAA